MSLYVEFLNRDFSERPKRPWKEVIVESYSNSAIGGSKVADLTIKGSSSDLWELAEMMRNPVVIWDEKRSKPVWWGYIESATLSIDGIRRKVDIRHMANNIAVAYTNSNRRETTTFATDTDSENVFGKREVRMSSVSVTDNQAQNYRDTVLDQRKYPNVSVPLANRSGRNFARVRCRGWFETLSWQYYNNDAGKIEYMDLDSFPGRTIQKQGDGRPRCAQGFLNSASSNWDLDKVYIRARKVEGGIGVGDDLEVYVYSDSGNEPDTLLSSGSIGAAELDTYSDWYEFDMSAGTTLVAGSSYWIVVQNQTYPAVDKDDYFFVDGNVSQGYVNGSFLLYDVNAASWVAWSKDMDMNFRVIGEEETTTQIESIVTNASEFLVGTDIVDASGLSTNPFRDGDNTAQHEIIKLLEKGTTDNKRLLARVLSNYRLEVYEEPGLFESDYTLQGSDIWDKHGNHIPPQECPVGVWMRYQDAIPTSVNTDRLSNASQVFVEEAEYRARDGRYHILKTRDVSEFRELFGNLDG